MGITIKELKKNKKEYENIYAWIKQCRRTPDNLDSRLLAINPAWENDLIHLFDDYNNNEANRDVFSKKVGGAFGWPDPITGKKYLRKDPVWWLLIGWWWMILKGIYKVCKFIARENKNTPPKVGQQM